MAKFAKHVCLRIFNVLRKKQMKNQKVFFSYSHRDKQIAQKIYWDLIRSGISVWRDQINGEPCANFKEEFLKKVEECEIFFVLDSANYRSNSTWCLLEIEKYFNKKNVTKRMFIGLLQSPGTWRKNYKNEREALYFNKLNEQIYIELFANGIYDNDAQYSQGIDKLIRYFGGTYLPWHQIPEEQDLQDELANIHSNYKMSDAERNSILTDFRIIRQRDLQKAPTTDDRINLWIKDCEFMQLNLIFPYLYLGIRLLNHEKFNEAKRLFQKITENHQEDPRGYRGLGLCLGNIGYYQESKLCYDKAIVYTMKLEGKHLQYLWEIFLNRARVLMELGQFQDAACDLNKALLLAKKSEIDVIHIILDLEFCYQQMNSDIATRITLLEEAKKINCLEEKIYSRLGNCFLEKSNWEKASLLFLRAFELDYSPRNAFALCLCYANLHNQYAINKTLKEIDIEDFQSEEDFYYYGFIQYILGKDNESKFYYNMCNPKLWKWYKDCE